MWIAESEYDSIDSKPPSEADRAVLRIPGSLGPIDAVAAISFSIRHRAPPIHGVNQIAGGTFVPLSPSDLPKRGNSPVVTAAGENSSAPPASSPANGQGPDL